ncbi:MAG: N-6 DNA methylase [Bacteroidetes bacterium]|nr:N-6 DNA methylase [Bacteroidota bacterium]
MKNIITHYLQSVSQKFKHEETSEMGYRKEFEILIEEIFESINVHRIDHDPKAKKGNKPDFIVMKADIPILYIEVKDIGTSLDKIEKSEQMARYFGYANLVLTDYLEFRFYRNGQRYEEPIKIANYNLKNRIISPNPKCYEHLAKSLIDFAQSHKEPIKSGLHLAKIMGGKAQRIRDNLLQFLSTDLKKNTEINKIYNTLKKLLVHDLTPDSFADMYAQTLVYGLFVARYHDETSDDFSRQEARDLVPASNPFLRHFFDHIAGADFDKRLKYLVDELCEVFSHANVPHLMKQYFKDDLWGKTHEGPDPVIHFYEDFLKEYDANLRKKMGAYYTPQPVVRFIVRSVDYLLKKEFGLSSGLADTSKLENGTHKVQILDPAVGTGTFLSAVIRSIYLQLKETGQIGRWPAYVHHDLLPRIHGFEIMMAPYTIAHLKLSMAFKATGFKHFNRRLGIYLTNSLEEADNIGDLFTGFGFAESIAEESKEASQIKNDSPIMVVIGNPPYSVSSTNKGEWILNLIKDYKKDLNERKINLDDDYIKFIRYSEHFVEKNKTGIVAMITNNSFIDGITHRQMRKHLLETFDEIYILDLHGNAKKKETAPDGSKDQNVFDIMQGVSISIFIRKNITKNKLGKVYFSEIFGKRDKKFLNLSESNIENISWTKLNYKEPYYFFVPKNFELTDEYHSGFKINNLLIVNNSGISTDRDSLFIDEYKDVLERRIETLLNGNYSTKFKNKFNVNDSSGYPLLSRISNKSFDGKYIRDYNFRPFDLRKIYFDYSITSRSAKAVSKQILSKNNLLLIIPRQVNGTFHHVFISNTICDGNILSSARLFGAGKLFPLYLYSKDGTKVPNLKTEIVKEIENTAGKTKPEEILDYIYAVLHSPNYRVKYKEFLKIEFPRVPYPKDKKMFKELVKLGTELRLLHLLESPKVNQFITTFPIIASDVVEKIKFENVGDEYIRPLHKEKRKVGNVWINKEQYFGNIPETAWNFYIGGYQPAQKWLKDRKGRKLRNSDIEHYQKIIVSLTETDRIMKEIDKIKFI